MLSRCPPSKVVARALGPGLIVSCLCLVAVCAQTVAPLPDREEETIDLSPFVVSGERETGWVASQSLAGTRLRTDLKDIPNQIETLTRDFMSDFAVNTPNDALIYTANTENNDEYVKATTGAQAYVPDQGGRIRGLSQGTLTRNFFQVQTASDNYNLDRATIASGPNAILFSLGSPAGILDVSPAKALLRDKYGATIQYDSEDSKRGTFDLNKVIVPDKAAIRLMGMSKKQYTFKKPNLDRDERLYAAATLAPFKNTRIHLQYEHCDREWNRANRVVPYDGVSLWLRANEIAGSGYRTARPLYANNSAALVPATDLIFTTAPSQPVFVVNGTVPLTNWRRSAIVKNPSTLPGVDPVFDAEIDYTILDPNVFPFDVNLNGNGRSNLIGGIVRTAIIEQKIARNLYAEFAYNQESAHNHPISTGGYTSSLNTVLQVDANQFIPGTTAPNPNVGKYYLEGYTNSEFRFYRNEDWRVSLAYELDLASKFTGWKKQLGRHTFSGLYSSTEYELRRQSGFERLILGEPVIGGAQALRARNLSNWAIHGTRRVFFRHYFDTPYSPVDPVSHQDYWSNWTMNDANGNPFTLNFLDTGLKDANGKDLGARAAAIGTRNRNKAQVFVWQGKFLPDGRGEDRLFLTYGYRKDNPEAAGFDAASVTRDFSGLYPAFWDAEFNAYSPSQSGVSRNYSIIGRPLKWLSVFYNSSKLYNVPNGQFGPFGTPTPGSHGEGYDTGIRLDLLENKLSLRISRFSNSSGPEHAPTAINGFGVNDIYGLEQRVLELDPSLSTISSSGGSPLAAPSQGAAIYEVTEDFKSTGYEFEFNYSPTRNWNLRLNGAFSEAEESNIGTEWDAFVQARLPVWKTVLAKNGEVDASGRPVTWMTALINENDSSSQTLANFYSTQIEGNALAYMRAISGRATESGRAGRANVLTKYTFTEGKLKGFGVGGAARWRAAPTIGYGTTTSSTGATVLDLDRAYKGKEELYFDAFIMYRGRMKHFGKAGYTVQLNVRNVLDEDSPVPFAATSTGTVAKLATVEPRLIAITVGLEL